MDPARSAFDDWTKRLALARVESYDVETDPLTNNPVLDDAGNEIPTGLLNITMLDAAIPRKKVPFALPVTGNSVFMGGLPEIGVMCVVGYRAQNQPIIIGFIPYGVDKMVRMRRTIPNLKEGEIMLQSSVRDLDVDKNQNFFRGARVWLDRYGRVKIDTTGYELIVGYVLANEFKSTVAFMADPVTKQPVFLREKLNGGVERRVDDKGNEVREYGGTAYVRTSQNVDVQAEQQITHTAFAGQQYRDRAGNMLEITADGIVRISSPSGSIEFSTQGSQKITIGGNVQESVMGGVYQTIGDRYFSQIGEGGYETETAGKRKETVTGGDWTEQITNGIKDIIAEKGINLETSGNSPVKVGSSDADQPIPLGNVLVQALQALRNIFVTNSASIGVAPPLGGPVPLNPAIITALKAWATQYLTTPATNIVSKKAFTERGL